MNNLKLKGLILGLICLFAFNINAQSIKEGAQVEANKKERTHKTPEEKAKKATDRMTEKLGLNEKQQAEIYKLNIEEIKSKDAIRSRMKDKLQAEQMARYKTVLNAEQFAKLEKSLADRQTKRKKGPHSRPSGAQHGKKGGMQHEKKAGHEHGKKGGMHGGKANPEVRAQKLTDRMTEKLGLNEKQQAEILAINMQEVANRNKMRIKMEQKFRNEQAAKYKTILTPEQFATMERMIAERRAKRAAHKEKQAQGQRKN